MIRRKRIKDLERDLNAAQAELREVTRQGHEREPVLRNLEKAVADNGLLELLLTQMEMTRRRRRRLT